MKILFASSEVFPFSKTGGLADVSSALPKALKEQGVEVAIITPCYKAVRSKFALENTVLTFNIPVGEKQVDGGIAKALLGETVPVYFLLCDRYFDRQELYTTKDGDYADNAERFIFFARAVVELAVREGYDVIHLNDWQSAMAALYAKDIYKWSGKTVMTIHNLGYQGVFRKEDFALTGLGREYFSPGKLEFWDQMNFLKAGIYYSDAVTTVSPRYAEEILEEENGFGLSGVLKDVRNRLYGILNGIDYTEWSPEKDRYLIKRYNIETVTKGKKECKKDLLRSFGINPETKACVFGMISRLAMQKGWDLLESAMQELIPDDVIFVILGTGERRYHDMLEKLKEKYPHKVGMYLGFNDELAHKIEAGADYFLMPSRYEPCGLNQMISMRYGTVPIVRGVGGLEDTVINVDDSKEGCGFKFHEYSSEALIVQMRKAVELFCDPLKFSRIRRRCMKKDFSWGASARQYIKLYEGLAANT